MTKLTKKKKILISLLTIFGALLVTAAVLVGLVFRPADIPVREDLGFETVCYELPDDADPTKHTGIENIGYMNWRLQHQNYWYSEAHVLVSNSMDSQNVSTYKQYYNGVLISTDISISNLVNKAVQYCQVRGGNVVLFRNSAGGKKTFDKMDTPWTTGKPDGHTIAEYKVKKGLPPLEFSVYILNENTVKEYSDIIDNGNGTYTQTFVLNFESEPMENDATYWYKTEMAYKANGMMKEEPQFSKVTVTYTFDDTWQVLSSATREEYKTITGVGAVNCVAESVTEYTYGDEQLCYNSEFENYYKNYMEDYEAPEDVVIDAAICLSEGFAGFLQDDTKLAVDLTVDGTEYAGNLQLNIPKNDIRVELGAIKVYMLEGGDYLYVCYGDDVKIKIALSDFASDEPAAASETDNDSSSDDEVGVLDKLLEALGDEENFELAEDKRSATLSPSINLGELLGIDLDITLNLDFKFNISEQKDITVEYVKANGVILGADFKAELGISQTGVDALTDEEAYTLININGITSLASAEALKLKLSYDDNGVYVDGNVIINLDGLAVKADLDLMTDGNKNAAKHLSLAYADNYVYLTLGSQGAQPAMLKASVDQAADLIADLTGAARAVEEEELDILNTVLNILQKIGTGNILNFLLSDDGLSSMLAVEGTSVAQITIDGTALLSMLGAEFELGNITAEIGEGLIGLSALGFSVSVQSANAFELDINGYKDAADLMPVVKKLVSLISDRKLSVKGALTLDIDGAEVGLDIKLLSVDWSDGLTLDISAYVTAGDVAENLLVSYGSGVARASIGNIGIELKDGDLDKLLNIVFEILGQTEDNETQTKGIEIASIFNLLGGEIDVFSIINSLEISGSDDSIIRLSLDGFEIVLIDETEEEGGILGLRAAYVDDQIIFDLYEAHITEYETPDGPDYEIEYFDSDYIMPVISEIAEYVKANGLSVSGSLQMGKLTLMLENLAVSWTDGIEIGAHISLIYTESEDKILNKDIHFEYSSERAALYYDNTIAVVLNGGDYDSFIDAVTQLINAISGGSEGENMPGLPDGEELISVLSEVEEESGSDIFAILSSLGFVKNADGNLEISLGGLTAELLVSENVIGASVAYGEGDSKVSAGISIGAYKAVDMPAGCDEVDAAELISLINDITEIVNNKGLTLSGIISLNIGSTTAKLNLYGISIGWADGIELQLDARLEVGDSVHDFYAQYNQTSGELKVVYGALDGGVGIDINIIEDAGNLEEALISVYGRIANLVNGSVAGGNVLPDTDGIDGLLDWIAAGLDTVRAVAELAETVEEQDGVNGISIVDTLNSLSISYSDGTVTLEVMGITVILSGSNNRFHLTLLTDAVGVEMEQVQIVDTATTDFGLGEYVDVLNAEDIADLLDYVAATVELFVKDTFNITLEGYVTSTEDAYAEVENNVKYKLNAGFEYQQGASGFPIHFVPETVNEDGETITPPDFWIAPDMYVHLYVNMESTLPEVDSVLFDIYIFDGNPALDSNGKTTSAALTSGDNELDIYMSISRISSAQAGKNGTGASEPLKIYAPMSEIMTVLSAGVALVDVGSMKIDALPELNGIISQVGSILDTMLVNRYFADTKDQFASVGVGLIETILGSSISDFINDLINGLTGGESDGGKALPDDGIATAAELSEGFGRIRSGAIDELTVDRNGNDTTFTLVVGETTTTVTKSAYSYTAGEGEDAVEHSSSRLTNLHVDKSALNGNEMLEGLDINIAYGGINRVTSLSGYTGFVGADELVKAIINSVTHEETAEDESQTYALNNNFFIDGEITLSFDLIGSIDAAKVTIDGLSVTFDEDGEVEVNLRMHYSGFSVWLLLTTIDVINGDSTVDLTVKNGMVYMKRVQTHSGGGLTIKRDIEDITIYRAMPVDDFMSDIMEQMIFLFNFGDTIANAIRGDGNDTQPDTEPGVKKDYGTQLAEYFKSFSLSKNANAGTAQWKAVISGTGLSNLAGISLGDITATFNAETDPAGGHVVNTLGIETSLFTVLGVTANLNWQNPQQQWRSNSAKSTSEDICANNPSVTAGEWLGGTSLEEIESVTKWDELLAATGQPYFEIAFTGENENILDNSISSNLKLRRQDYYFRTSIYGQEEEFITSLYVLYIGQTEFTIYTAPDLNDYAIAHSTANWISQTNGNVQKFTIVYTPNKYMVYFTSGHALPDFGTEWSYEHSYGTLLSFDFSAELRGGKEDIWYRVDYLLINGKQYTVENIHELEITEETYVEVIWKEIPHATVTVESENPIEGFEEVDGKWYKDFEIETCADVNLAQLVGDIADFGDYVYGGFTLAEGEEQTSDTVNISGDTTVYVKWISPEITVTYYSSLQLDGYAEANTEGYTEVYSSTATYNAGTGFGAGVPSYDGYTFLGWYYNDPTNGWMPVSNVKTDVFGSDKYSAPVELHAAWAQATIDGSGSTSSSWGTHSYTVKSSVSIETFGHSDLISRINLLSAKFNFSASSASKEATNDQRNTDGSISVENVQFSYYNLFGSATKTVNVTVTFGIEVNGIELKESWSKSGSFTVS